MKYTHPQKVLDFLIQDSYWKSRWKKLGIIWATARPKDRGELPNLFHMKLSLTAIRKLKTEANTTATRAMVIEFLSNGAYRRLWRGSSNTQMLKWFMRKSSQSNGKGSLNLPEDTQPQGHW